VAPEFGLGRGKVFPAEKASSLLNPLRRLVQSPERTVGRMQLRGDAHVLEVGCGPGFFSPSIERAVPRGRLVQLDLQIEMLRVARDRMSSACLVSADASKLPFASGSFDAVFVSAMVGEVPDRDGCLAQIRRVLRAGGEATFAETRRDSDFISLDALSELLLPHGFELADRSGIRWQYVARFRAK
jgi:ubiquinone/menaquinone biosynthesis C-methylase UbiE